jgi:hypothetical protein
MRSLRQCLLDTEPVMLRIVAARWSLDPTGLKPRELAEKIEDTIGSPARATPLIEVLPDAERDALRVLLAAGGTLPVANFAQRFGSVRSVGPARLEREQLWRNPISPAENLWYLGLLYRGFEQLPNGAMREVFFAPSELLPLLPLLKSTARAIEPLEISVAPAHIRSVVAHAALADDMCTLLSHLHNNFVRVSANTLRSAIPALQTAALWRDAEAERLAFILQMADRAQLLRLTGQRLRPNSYPCADWLCAATLDQLRVLFEAWRTDVQWDDFKHMRRVQVERATSLRNDPAAVRAVVLDAVRAAVPGAWHTVDALCARLKAQAPDFLRADFDVDYLKDATTGEYLRGFAAWDRVEGMLIRYLISSPLFWLGAIDLEAGTAPTLFCLTSIGAALLGLSTEQTVAPAESWRFAIHADATIDLAAARRYDRFQLARVADLIVIADDEYRYRLSPSSLMRAASQKISAAKVSAFLTEASGQSVPLSLRKAIERWNSKGTEVKVERAVIVQVNDAAILKRLQESPKTRGIAIEVLGPTAARINEKDWPKLVTILAEAGVLVDLEADR